MEQREDDLLLCNWEDNQSWTTEGNQSWSTEDNQSWSTDWEREEEWYMRVIDESFESMYPPMICQICGFN